jgi:hypothetical protein
LGFWSSVKKGIKKAAKAVSKAVNKATDFGADIVSTLGHGIGDALSWLGDKIPGVGGVFRWLGGVINGATDFAVGVIKGAGAFVGGLLSGVIRILGGVLTLDWDGIVGGLQDIFVEGLGGLIVSIGGTAIGFIQSIFGVWSRPLNNLEVCIARRIFRGAIATHNVRVVDGSAGIYSLGGNNRPFVLNDTMYMKNYTALSEPHKFAHEFIHIWQSQHTGSGYASEAIGNQWWGVEYDWVAEVDKGKPWEDFEREAQGASIEEMYLSGGTVPGAMRRGAFFTDDGDERRRMFVFSNRDFTALGNEAINVIRGETPWRLSALFNAECKEEPVIEVTSYVAQNWLITPAALAVNETAPAGIRDQKYVLILSGVAIAELEGNSGSTWRKETIAIRPDVGPPLLYAISRHAIPTPPGTPGVEFYARFQVEQLAPFAAMSSIFNKDESVNSGFAVDEWRLLPFFSARDAISNVTIDSLFDGIEVDVAVRDVDARIDRLSYSVALLGRIVFIPHVIL